MRGNAFHHTVAGIGAGAVVTHKGLQGAIAAYADADRVVRSGFGGGDGQTILTITDVNNTGGHAGVSFVNRIANAGQRGICRADIDGHRIFTVSGGKGDLAVSRGNGRFGIRLCVFGRQGLRLRQLRHADGVFTGNRAAGSGGAECRGATRRAGRRKQVGFIQRGVCSLKRFQRTLQRAVSAKLGGIR